MLFLLKRLTNSKRISTKTQENGFNIIIIEILISKMVLKFLTCGVD